MMLNSKKANLNIFLQEWFYLVHKNKNKIISLIIINMSNMRKPKKILRVKKPISYKNYIIMIFRKTILID